ncbi:hypothetical protein ACFWZ4_00480 [Frateuria sp. GZRe12]|uniref:hypothetical protein n=1 Tax=Frateuria sp. GZRe12 TaxID=3351533 RepID=UPI003EDC7654
MQRWLIAAAVAYAALIGCTEAPEDGTAIAARRPQQAGQPIDPLVTAGHLAVIDAAALAGDQRAIQTHTQAMQKDMLRSMRVPDPAQPIDHEAARAAVHPLPGVRSSIWVDRTNLLVMVGGSRYRSMETIDRVCLALEPLGDTLAVVVNLQDATATTFEGADTLSRNCQLAEGERALLQPKRQVDVLDPKLRRVFQTQQAVAR